MQDYKNTTCLSCGNLLHGINKANSFSLHCELWYWDTGIKNRGFKNEKGSPFRFLCSNRELQLQGHKEPNKSSGNTLVCKYVWGEWSVRKTNNNKKAECYILQRNVLSAQFSPCLCFTGCATKVSIDHPCVEMEQQIKWETLLNNCYRTCRRIGGNTEPEMCQGKKEMPASCEPLWFLSLLLSLMAPTVDCCCHLLPPTPPEPELPSWILPMRLGVWEGARTWNIFGQ